MLGGRWTYAFYKILGDKVLSDRLIASNLKDYVARAVGLGRSRKLREDTEQRIRTALPRLYQRKDSIKSWEDALLKIARVELSIN
jgi:predicted O-linked N-acetylglucosamine transferase (SPINDLY family)